MAGPNNYGGQYGGQTPGGNSQVNFNWDTPVPGNSYAHNKGGTSSNAFASGANQNSGNSITDRSSTRIHQAPGGASSDIFGTGMGTPGYGYQQQQPQQQQQQQYQQQQQQQQPQGSFVTGNVPHMSDAKRRDHAGSDIFGAGPAPNNTYAKNAGGTSSNAFASGANQNSGNVLTDRSSTRIHQAPGGASSDIFGTGMGTPGYGYQQSPQQPQGQAFVTGHVPHMSDAKRKDQMGSDIFGGGPAPNNSYAKNAGGTSSNAFASGANQNSGNVLTDRSSTRIHQAPGGASSDIFGTGMGTPGYGYQQSPQQSQGQAFVTGHVPHMSDAKRRDTVGSDIFGAAPAPNNTYAKNAGGQSSNAFASGANQNSGNVLTDRSSTRIHQAPGGASSDIFGTGMGTPGYGYQQQQQQPQQQQQQLQYQQQQQQQPWPQQQTPTKGEAFVTGHSPFMSDAKRRDQAGSDIFNTTAPTRGQSSNAFANGANQNAGNVITDRSTTRINAPPGGKSSITFG